MVHHVFCSNYYYAFRLEIFKNREKGNGKFIRIYFDKHYFFYKNPDKLKIDDIKTEKGFYLLEQFVTKEEIKNYSESLKSNNVVDGLFDKYVKKKK